MNIFVLDKNPKLCAQQHCDKHVVKMILETAQLLSTALRFHGVDHGYKSTHKNHPCSIWARQTRENFTWLNLLGRNLLDEYTHRYGKQHKSTPIITEAPLAYIPEGPLTPFALAMPDKYRADDPVESYRNYYKNEKLSICKYTSREWPEWLKQ